MFWVILAIPFLSLFTLLAFIFDEWEEEKQKAKEEEEFQKKKREFEEKYLRR